MSDRTTPEALPPVQGTPQPGEELRRLGVQLGTAGLPAPHKRSARATAPNIESVIPGQVLDTPYGPCFLVETCYPLGHVHGAHRLSQLAPEDRPSPLLARLVGDETLSQLDYRHAIFFDIETSGLGIASGVYAFMVGFGTFEGDCFCLRQYFLRDYHEEEAMLYLLAEQMQDSRWWVSFNGRNFDLPILQTRFVCGGYREMPLLRAAHLDLLYPARRLWRKRLASCALSSLESNLLGLTRDSDVPGWMIPELYFDYLRYGDVLPLRQVFLHNALDVLSLVTLTARVEETLGYPPGRETGHAVDGYSLGMVYESLGEAAAAQRAYEWALSERLPADLQGDALRRLSLLHKRTGSMYRAVRIWQSLCEQNDAYAYVELAKYHEHRRRDYHKAATLVREALCVENLPATGQCARHELRYRLARLQRKLGERSLPVPHIQSYSFGTITVDGKSYDADLLITPDGVLPSWWRKKGHSLHGDDLQDIIEAKPSVVVVGTGNVGRMQVPQDTLDFLATHGIRTEVQRTAAACQRYNELAQTERAAAALHLTC